jgi:hypothetical protein
LVYASVLRGAAIIAMSLSKFWFGCPLVLAVPADRAEDAVKLLEAHHPGAAIIGSVTDAGGTVAVPSLGITGDKSGLRAA